MRSDCKCKQHIRDAVLQRPATICTLKKNIMNLTWFHLDPQGSAATFLPEFIQAVQIFDYQSFFPGQRDLIEIALYLLSAHASVGTGNYSIRHNADTIRNRMNHTGEYIPTHYQRQVGNFTTWNIPTIDITVM